MFFDPDTPETASGHPPPKQLDDQPFALQPGHHPLLSRDLVQVLQHMNFQPEDVPNTSRELRELPHETRLVCAIFTHSLERNGATLGFQIELPEW